MEDLFIVVDQGYFGEDSASHSGYSRVRVSSQDGKIIEKVGTVKVHSGFGVERQGAVRDFIQRNSSKILERIFNAF